MSFDQGHQDSKEIKELDAIRAQANAAMALRFEELIDPESVDEKEDIRQLEAKIIEFKTRLKTTKTVVLSQEYKVTIVMDFDMPIAVPRRGTLLVDRTPDWPIYIPNIPLLKLAFRVLSSEGLDIYNGSIRSQAPIGAWQRDDMEFALDRAFGTNRNFLRSVDTEEVYKRFKIINEKTADLGKKNLLAAIVEYKQRRLLFVDDLLHLGKNAELEGHDYINVERIDPSERRKYSPYNDFRFLYELFCRIFIHASAETLLTLVRKYVLPEEKAAQKELEQGITFFLIEREILLNSYINIINKESSTFDDKKKACFYLLRNFHAVSLADQEKVADKVIQFVKKHLDEFLEKLLLRCDEYKKSNGLSINNFLQLKEDFNELMLLVHLNKLSENCGINSGLSEICFNIINITIILSAKVENLLQECRNKLSKLIDLYRNSKISEKIAIVSYLEQVLQEKNEKLILEHAKRCLQLFKKNKIVLTEKDYSQIFYSAFVNCSLIKVNKTLVSVRQLLKVTDAKCLARQGQFSRPFITTEIPKIGPADFTTLITVSA